MTITHVLNRHGVSEEISFDKILQRITRLAKPEWDVDPVLIAKKVISGIYDGVTTAELDVLAAETCASLVTSNPQYSFLGSSILISSLHKRTASTFSECVKNLLEYDLVNTNFASIVAFNSEKLDAAIDDSLDYEYSYFGYKTLEKSYLKSINGHILERPQYMLMRVAVGIQAGNKVFRVDEAIETYNLLSQRFYTHATPTLYNAGTLNSTMASCFLLGTTDSMSGIYSTVRDCANISKFAGGIGLHVSNIRAEGSYIKGTGGQSSGLVPMIKVYEATARYANQGGKRAGAFAIYVEPWHPDIFKVLDLKKNGGAEELRARDLFFAMWTPDLFMKRVQEDGKWTLLCPSIWPNLNDVYGEEFEKLYEQYENDPRTEGKTVIRAQKLWDEMITSQIETGGPYVLYKDACNKKSNQKFLGTIKSSNLCCEILINSDADTYGVCVLASISLPAFVNGRDFDYKKLHEVAKKVTRNLDTVTDANQYNVPQTKTHLLYRPIGVGVQGLANVFMMMRAPFESEKAEEINRKIFATIYHGALEASCEMACEKGPHARFDESPMAQGILQFDLWNVESPETCNGLLDWERLKDVIKKYGVRNSLVTALMPTASTAQILNNTESFEPPASNIYARRVQSGTFQVVNKYLYNDLVERGLWSKSLKDRIVLNNGSIQNIDEIPKDLKDLYKTVWEIKQKALINLAAGRAPYIDQTQSMNLFLINQDNLSAMLFYGWKKGLKTGSYYIRTKTAVNAIKYSLESEEVIKATEPEDPPAEQEGFVCTWAPGCDSCAA